MFGESRERRSYLSHRSGSSEPVPDDVSHSHSDSPIRQLKGVEPVASDLERVTPCLIQRRYSDVRAIDDARRQERPLKPHRDLALFGFQGQKSSFGLPPAR